MAGAMVNSADLGQTVLQEQSDQGIHMGSSFPISMALEV